jgi:uncharacterized protein YndB with AHSA1/START domain
MPDILHKIGIQKSSPIGVYHALTTVEGLSGWWTETGGEPDKIGGTINFRFGKGGMDMTVIEAEPGKRVVWEVAGGHGPWRGTRLTFDLRLQEATTIVLFGHLGWPEPTELFAHSTTKWAVFLLSLKQFLETGRGRPVPNDIPIED